MLLVAKQTVGRMALEVVPDLFGRIELRRVARERFDMQTGIGSPQFSNEGAFVDSAIVPYQNDWTLQMSEECAKKPGHMHRLEVVLLKPEI